MILTADYHTHTPYSHGKNTVAENVATAKERGLKEVAITDHGFSHVVYGLRRKELAAYKAECAAAEKEYGIRVLVGIESNIRGTNGLADLTEKDYEDFDVFLCGNHIFIHYATAGDAWRLFWRGSAAVHFGWKGSSALVRANTQAYIRTIERNPVDAVSHLRYDAPCNVVEVAKCAADYGTYIELNAKKTHLTDEELNEIVQKTSARFIIDSDAHSAERVGDTKLAETQIARVGVPLDRIDNIDGRFPRFRFAEYKKRM